MRFSTEVILKAYFLKEDFEPNLDENEKEIFNEDDYTLEEVDIFTIDYMYESFYDENRKAFKYTVIGTGGEQFCVPLRKKYILDLVKTNKKNEQR